MMKAEDILFGGASLLGLALSINVKDKIYQIALISAASILLIATYLSTTLRDLKRATESNSLEIKKIHEKVEIYKELARHEARLEKLEVSKKWK